MAAGLGKDVPQPLPGLAEEDRGWPGYACDFYWEAMWREACGFEAPSWSCGEGEETGLKRWLMGEE